MNKLIKNMVIVFSALILMGIGQAYADVSVTRTSAPDFYIDVANSPSLLGQYASYQISNTGVVDYEDVWVKISNFGAGDSVQLGANAADEVSLGALALGETRTAFFYLVADEATGQTNADQTHDISVSEGPSATGTVITATGDTSNILASIDDAGSANSNTVTATLVGPSDPSLGGIMTLTVEGSTGVVNGSGLISMSASAYADWDAATYQQIASHMTLVDGVTTVELTDDLYELLPGTWDYTIVYTFRAVGVATRPTTISPVGYMNNGTIKHTNTATFDLLPPIFPAENVLRISNKSASPSSFASGVGGTVTYTVTVENTAALTVPPELAPLTDVSDIVDTLPASATYVANSAKLNGATYSEPTILGQVLTWDTNFSIAAAGTVNLTYDVVIPSVDGSYGNSVVAHAGLLQIDTTLDTSDDVPAVAFVFVGPPEADLVTTKAVDDATPNEGQTITYTLTVTNNGPGEPGSIVVTDTLPAGVTYVSDTPSQGVYTSSTGEWAVGTLTNGASATLDIVATVDAATAGTLITNTVSNVTADQTDPTTVGDVLSVAVNVNNLTDADLVTTKVVDDAAPDESQAITYTLSVTNDGPAQATGVVVTDALPAGVSYSADTPSQGAYSPGTTDQWTVGTLNSGATATLSITATVNGGTAGTTITNTITNVVANEVDPSTVGDILSAGITVNNATDADLVTTKIIDNAAPLEGGAIQYTITVTNNGPAAATNVSLVDYLPAGTAFVSSTPSQGTYNFAAGTWTIGTINNAAAETLTIDATVGSGTSGTTVTNTVLEILADQNDPSAAGDSLSASFTATGDSTSPIIWILNAPSIVNSAAAFNVTFEFDEDVTGFALGDITVTNGSASNFVVVDGNTYTADITPDGVGDISIDVAVAVALDLAGNSNVAASTVTVTYDVTAPTTPTVTSILTNNTTPALSGTADAGDTVTVVVGGATYTVTAIAGNTWSLDTAVAIPTSGTFSLVEGANNIELTSDNGTSTVNVPAAGTITLDTVAPTVSVLNAPSSVTTTAVFNVTFEFSEDVTGFVLGDITIGNGTASNFVAVDGNTYTADITPSGTGDITIDVAAGVASDSATNTNTAATTTTVTYAVDITPPTIDIQGEPTIVNSAAAYSVTFEFSENVTGFALGDITVGNGTASNFIAVDGNTYTADITPSGVGNITIDVAASVVQDTAGNNNTAATQAVTVFDNVVPTMDIQGEPVIVNSTAAYSVTFEFSETVTGFVIGDITVGNGAASNFIAVDGNTYTADITPSGAGDITIDVAANVAIDAAANNNTAATQAVTTFDNVAPSIDIQGEPTIVNSAAAYSVTFEFSENVTGVALGDITVGNGTASNFIAVDGNTYTADITPSGAGDITIDVAANVAVDAASNNNTAATQAVTVFDNVAPTVDIQGEPTIVNTTAAYSVTFEFSETVTGFVIADITVGNGSASNFIAVDGNTYTADITPGGAGDIAIDVAANVAQDAATNNNTAATQAVTVFDNVVPTVDIQGEPVIVNSTAAYSVTFEFSETVTGFVIADITVGNGAVSNFIAVDGNTYTADITPSGAGNITIDVAANVAIDAASNNNTAATQVVTVFDNVAPTVDIQGEPVAVNNTAAYSVTFEFSENVTGFVIGDITVGNGAASNFIAVDGNTYTADITPSGAGDITIDVAANVAVDAAANNNTAATQAITTFDNVAPTVDIQGEPAIVNSTTAYSVTFEFSETVTGFIIGDITVGNGTASNFIAVDGNTYTADITPSGAGNITIDVAANVAVDAASNNNTAAIQAVTVFDNVAPTVDIQGEPSVVNTTATYSVTFEFSETVTGFVVGDISVGNGSASNFVAVDGNTYTADITPSGAGDITIDVAANVAVDVASNNNTAATQAITIFDNVAPTVDIQGEPAAVNNTTAYNVTFEFSETVTGFVIGDITVGNGAASNFIAVDGNTYTADITPSGAGDITIDVAANVAVDAASNNNTAATQAITTFDNVAPTVDIQGEPAIVNSTTAYSVTFEFSENVTGFVIGDITVGNGAASNFIAIDGNTYTADITPSGAGDITIDVAANVAIDAASNNNTAATQAVTVFDNVAPTVDIQGEPSVVNTTATYSVTFEFSETVTGFVVGDITVGNGAVSNFIAVDGNTYTADITPSGAGDITIDVAANVAQDSASNNNTAATQASTSFDNTAPVVAVTSAPVANIANETTYAVSGTCTIGDGNVTVSISGASPANQNVICTAGGTWSATFDVSGIADGMNALTIDASQTDTAGNTGNATTVQADKDTVAPASPTYTIQTTNSSAPTLTGTAEANSTVTIVVGGATYTVTADGSGNWTLDTSTATPDSGTLSLVEGANNVSVTATDAAGNSTSNATAGDLTLDTTVPTVDIQGEPAAVNNTTAYNVTFEFSETVTGFVVGDITVGNGSASNFVAVDGNTYTADITPSGAGDITIDVAANAAQDVATNNNTAATQAMTVFDNVAPTVDIQGEPAIVNTTAAYSVTFEFSENVTGFIIGDISVGNGSASNFIAVDGNTYTADITPSGAGDITIDVAANAAQDVATNNNTAAMQAVTTFDNTAPVVAVTSAPVANIANETTYAVSGTCTVGDGDVTVSITGASPANQNVICTAGGTWSATFDVSGIADGMNALTIDASQTDTAGNTGNATQVQADKDTVAPASPTYTIQTTSSSTPTLTGTAEANSTVTVVVGGATYTVTATAGGSWILDTSTVTPDSGTLNLVEGANNVSVTATDAAGNSTTNATAGDLTLDTVAPVVVITSAPVANIANETTYLVSGTCTIGDGNVTVSISGASPVNQNVICTAGGTWSATFDVSGIADGTNALTIDASQTDAGGGTGNATTVQADKDTVAPAGPTYTVQTTNNSTPTLTGSAEANSTVTVVVGGATYTVTATAGGNWILDTATVTPDSGTLNLVEGANNVSVTATDAVGNSTTNATAGDLTLDTTVPTVDIQGEPSIVNTTAAYSVTFEFSETVTGFAVGDITLSNATLSSFVTVDGNTYTADITPDGLGDITIDVAANVAQDSASNNNTAATQAVTVFDNVAPAVDIQGEPAAVNTAAAYSVTFEFSETVTGFAVGDITLSNATLNNFITVDGNTYTADITPDGLGDITIDVAANVAVDVASNNNTAATQAVTVFDNTAPVVAVTSAPVANIANETTYAVSGTCTVGDGDVTVSISGASPANQSVTCTAGGTWNASFDVSGIADSMNALTIDASQTDAAGNTGNATTVQADKDTTAPVIPTVTSQTTNNTTPTISGTAEADSVVTIVVGGATYTVTATAGGGWSLDTATATPDSGTLSLAEGANSVFVTSTDAAGNTASDITVDELTLDTIAPTTPTVDGLVTSDTTPTITGTATLAAGETLSVTINGATYDNVPVILGMWSIDTGTVVPSSGTLGVFNDGNSYEVVATVTDAATNSSSDATMNEVVIDATLPTVDIQGEPASVNNTAAFNVTFEFSETVTGFVVGDITLSNATVSNFTAVDGNTYTADITPDSGGDITIDVAANVAQDGAGNNNTAATQAVTVFDSTAPSILILSAPAFVMDTSAFNVTFEFNEDVTGFTQSDITIGNGSASNFIAVDGNTYTADITPDGTGNISIDVAANIAQDIAGNDNTAASTVEVILDSDGDGLSDEEEAVAGTDINNADSDGDGIPDATEVGATPGSPLDTDNDGIIDALDVDSDNDGIPDILEGNADADGDGTPNYLDTDSNNDGIDDSVDSGVTGIDTDGDGIDDIYDADADGDMVVDAGKTDANDDGVDDAAVLPNTDLDAAPDVYDLDSDNDGLPNLVEGGLDTDSDGIADYLDVDSDNDGILDVAEVDATGIDTDGDGIDDAYDASNVIIGPGVGGAGILSNATDTDGDTVPDYLDLDSDNDSIVDVTEAGFTDSDGDALLDAGDTANATPQDTDLDTVPDYRDLDSDNVFPDDIVAVGTGADAFDLNVDGRVDIIDTTPADGIPDNDLDRDGILDEVDSDPGIRGTSTDADGDGISNSLDLDDDNDGIPDAVEAAAGDVDTDGDGIVDRLDRDSDNDGIPDSLEGDVGVVLDTDGDGVIDAVAFIDANLDGLHDAILPGMTPADTDNDGTPDFRDLDSDNDGLNDLLEAMLLNSSTLDANGDGLIDDLTDIDMDGFADVVDTQVTGGTDGTALRNPDTDGDGIPNYRDTDSDNDGYNDAIENGDFDGDGRNDALQPGDTLNTAVTGTGGIGLLWLMMLSGLLLLRSRVKARANLSTALLLAAFFMTAITPIDSIAGIYDCARHVPFDKSEEKDFNDCWYLGGGLGVTHVEPEGSASGWRTTDSSDSGYSLYVGKHFKSLWFGEFIYSDLGEAGLTNFNPSITGTEKIAYTVPTVHVGRFLWEPERTWNFYAKAGISAIQNEATTPLVPFEKTTSVQLTGGVGVQWRAESSGWFARLGGEFYDRDANYIGVSIGYYLGGKDHVAAEPEPTPEPVIEPVIIVPPIEQPDEVTCLLFEGAALKGVTFRSGSVNLTADAEKVLNDAVQSLKNYPELLIEVQAHTDSVGSEETNQRLSARRANTVMNFMITGGVRPDQLIAKGYGETRPIASNETKQGRAINRRVVFKLLNENLCKPVQSEAVVMTAPVATAPTVSNQSVGVCKALNRVIEGVSFYTAFADLTDEAKQLLNKTARDLKASPDVRVEVQAYTDSLGAKKYNQALSEKRAASVMDYLIERGVGAERLTSKGYGEDQPIASNRVKLGREKNRRVELRILNEGMCSK